MQNLINQLITPDFGETKPSMVKRRAGEQLKLLATRAEQDTKARILLEQDHRLLTRQFEDCRQVYGPSNHADEYQDAMNKDQDAAFN